MLSTCWLDLKLGVRMLIKYPGLALAGGAGIAVAVAIAAGGFSVIYGNFLLTALPLPAGDRIVSLEMWDSAASKAERRALRDYRVWREELKSVVEISAFRTITPNLIVPGAQPMSVRVAAMTASGFGVARVQPLMGRYLMEDDEREGVPAVVVIGESVWRDQFGSDPAILGRTIQLGAVRHSIAGVMPEGYAFPLNHHLWVPLRTGIAPPQPLTGPELMVFGRLAPGATLAAAKAELSAIGGRAVQQFPTTYAHIQPRVMPYAYPFLGMQGKDDMAGVMAMQGLFLSLLGVVCLNVAILVYTRTATRQAEIAVRTALGASRGRIVGQLFLEALVLAAVAAAAGVGIAMIALRLVAMATQHVVSELPFWITFQLIPEAVLYAGALSVFAAAIVGIAPALRATRSDPQHGLRIIGSGGSGMRLGKTWTALIVAQVAFAVAFLPPAVSSAWEDTRDGIAGLGFPAEQYLSAQLGMDIDDAQRFAARQTELMRRLEAEPGVSGVTFSLRLPGDESNTRVGAEGVDAPPQLVRINRVDVDLFRTFDVPVLAGRALETADIASTGAVVINLSFAQKTFGGNALGRRIRYAGNEEWHQIVGIVPDFPTGVSPGMRDISLKVYHAVAPGQVRPAALAIRMRGGDPLQFSRRLREVAAAVDPDLHLRYVRRLDEAMYSEQWISRLQAAVAGLVTLSVLLLSSAGIYALMSFTVSQRRKEIGIRAALGADWRRIVTSIFSRALLQLAAGAALGLALGIALEKGTSGGVMRGNAAVVLPAVALFMMLVGFLAALGPARRCLRIEPTQALREE